jgi:hypothetical protein
LPQASADRRSVSDRFKALVSSFTNEIADSGSARRLLLDAAWLDGKTSAKSDNSPRVDARSAATKEEAEGA